jgi:hypothetical protein
MLKILLNKYLFLLKLNNFQLVFKKKRRKNLLNNYNKVRGEIIAKIQQQPK